MTRLRSLAPALLMLALFGVIACHPAHENSPAPAATQAAPDGSPQSAATQPAATQPDETTPPPGTQAAEAAGVADPAAEQPPH